MRLLTLDSHWRRWSGNGDTELEAGLVIEVPGRWIRLAAFYGGAPGSHIIDRHFTVWRTRVCDLSGWNLRAGWWPKPCVTLLAHTRPARKLP